MRSHSFRVKTLVLLAFIALGLSACGFGGNAGRLSLSLTDVATDRYQAVYVTIREVAVHKSGDTEDSWKVVAAPNRTYNLLNLVNGVRENLALAELPSGHYTQLRLLLGDTPDNGVNILSRAHPYANYVVDNAGQCHEIKVPSGFRTGVKVVQGFDINENQTTELILDFDASKSVVVAGRSGQYLMKPTIRVLTASDASVISGSVTKAADQAAVQGACVSAQVYDASAADPRDRVTVRGATLSSETGAYKLFVAPGTYNVVAVGLGFAPLAAVVAAEAGMTYTQDFALVEEPNYGKVSGTVTISGSDGEAYATLSFRQTVSLGGSDIEVEVQSVNVRDGATYTVDLPVGLYTVVSSTAGMTTQEASVSVSKDTTTTLDITF
jgi:hypothetical protein